MLDVLANIFLPSEDAAIACQLALGALVSVHVAPRSPDVKTWPLIESALDDAATS